MAKNYHFYFQNGTLFVKGFHADYGCEVSYEVTPDDPLYAEGMQEIRKKRSREQSKITLGGIAGHFELIT